MITENQAKQMVAEMAGLKRWKSWKAGFGDLVCEDEDNYWHFQIPTNITVYDPEGNCLSKIPAVGEIDKETGKIDVLIFIWENPWKDLGHGFDEEDIPKRYRKYPLEYHEDVGVYVFDTVEKAKKFLGWIK